MIQWILYAKQNERKAFKVFTPYRYRAPFDQIHHKPAQFFCWFQSNTIISANMNVSKKVWDKIFSLRKNEKNLVEKYASLSFLFVWNGIVRNLSAQGHEVELNIHDIIRETFSHARKTFQHRMYYMYGVLLW